MINTTELRIRVKRISTIITSTNPAIGPLDKQLEIVDKWSNSASRTILHSTEKPIQHAGLRLNLTAKSSLPVADMLRAYVVQIPGSEVFALAAPNVLISENQKEFFDHVEKQKMERAWAAYATAGESVPRLFIITAPVLPHILRDIPNSLTFANEEWAKWLHNWLGRFMLQHRYFSADQFNLATLPKQPAVVAIPEPIVQALEPMAEPVAVEPAPAAQEPVKRKGGRKKKEA